MRQLLSETVLVSLMGTAAGLVLAVWLLDVIVALAPRGIPRLADVSLNLRVVGASAAVGLGAGLLSGLAPAWHFSRPSHLDALSAGRGATATRTGRIMSDGLAATEIALAVALVTGAGLLLRSFSTLIAVDPGFRADRVLALQVFAYERQNTDERKQVFFRETIADVRGFTGVVDVAAVSAMPMIDANIDVQGPFAIEGRAPLSIDERPVASLTVVTPSYFGVMGIPVLRGRVFTSADTTAAEPVAVVSRSLADRHWPGVDPMGSWLEVRFSGRPRRVQVVGVVDEVRHDALDRPAREEIFLPLDPVAFGSMTYVIRSAGDPARLAEPARQAIWRHDPLLTFYDTKTVDELMSASVAPRRFSLVLATVFGAVALLLAAAGIYGVLSFTTGRQTREFGVRLAMGATSREIGRLVLGRGLRLGLICLACGLLASFWAGQALRSMLFEVSPYDPATLAGVAVLTLAVSLTACYLPARRAMRVDPLVALRE
jgi:putative ABC transport system permease protein